MKAPVVVEVKAFERKIKLNTFVNIMNSKKRHKDESE